MKGRLCAEKTEGRGGSAARRFLPSPAPALDLRAEVMASMVEISPLAV
jgi:hypothetical protein